MYVRHYTAIVFSQVRLRGFTLFNGQQLQLLLLATSACKCFLQELLLMASSKTSGVVLWHEDILFKITDKFSYKQVKNSFRSFNATVLKKVAWWGLSLTSKRKLKSKVSWWWAARTPQNNRFNEQKQRLWVLFTCILRFCTFLSHSLLDNDVKCPKLGLCRGCEHLTISHLLILPTSTLLFIPILLVECWYTISIPKWLNFIICTAQKFI